MPGRRIDRSWNMVPLSYASRPRFGLVRNVGSPVCAFPFPLRASDRHSPGASIQPYSARLMGAAAKRGRSDGCVSHENAASAGCERQRKLPFGQQSVGAEGCTVSPANYVVGEGELTGPTDSGAAETAGEAVAAAMLRPMLLWSCRASADAPASRSVRVRPCACRL